MSAIPHWLKVGVVLTRDGTDRQRVLHVSDGGTVHVVCIRASELGWCAAGDEDWLDVQYLSRDDLAEG